MHGFGSTKEDYADVDGHEQFFEEFVARTSHSCFFASPLFAMRGIREAMVDLSDNGELMIRFLRLPFREPAVDRSDRVSRPTTVSRTG